MVSRGPRLNGINEPGLRQLRDEIDRALRQVWDRLCGLESASTADAARPPLQLEASEQAAATLQAAVDQVAASSCGRTIVLRPGRYVIDSPIRIPSGVLVYGMGACIVLPAGSNFAAFDLDGVDDVIIDDVRFESEGAPGGQCYGILIRGASSRIRINRCTATALGSGFAVRGADGSTPGTVRDALFADCHSDGNLGTYGFQASHADGVTWADCSADRNRLDGFKIRVLTDNVRLRHCTARENGWPSGFGDGLDAYAGGDSFVVDGFVSIDNIGNGMTIKTDVDTRDDPSNFGYTRRIQLSNCICRGNFYGVFLATNTGSVNQYNDDNENDPVTAATIPQPKHATIANCEVAENAFQGLYVNMVGVTIHGGIYRSNGYDGIQIGLRSLFVDVYSPMLVANGTDATDGGYNMYVRGKYCRIHSPQFFGVDPDIVREETDYTGPMVPIANLAVGSSATVDNIEVIDPWEDPTSEGTVTTANTTADIRFHLRGAGTPEGNYRGGVGSTFKQTDATEGRDAHWMKVSGTPASASGWAPFTPGNINDANSGFGDWAFGALDEAVSGISILNDGAGLGGVAFVSTAGGLQGALEYSHDAATMYFRVGSSQVFRANAAAILPQTHEGLLVGSDSVRFSRSNVQSYAGNFQDSPAGLELSWYAVMDDGESTALPAASGRTGVTYLVEHSGAAEDVTIGRAGGDTINGAAANFALGAGQLAMCVSDGTSDWRVSIIGPASTGPGGTDHGGLTGLGDDDHPQYLLADGSRHVVGQLTMDRASGGDYILLAEDASALPAAGDHRLGRPGTGATVWAWYDGAAWLNAIVVTDTGVTRITDLVAVDSAELAGLTYPTADGSAGHVMTTDGAGTLSLASVASVLPNGLDQVGSFGGETLYWSTFVGEWRPGVQLRHGDSPSGWVEVDRTLIIEGGPPGGNSQALEFRDISSSVTDGDHRLFRTFLDDLRFQRRSGGAWVDWLTADANGDVSVAGDLDAADDVTVGGLVDASGHGLYGPGALSVSSMADTVTPSHYMGVAADADTEAAAVVVGVDNVRNSRASLFVRDSTGGSGAWGLHLRWSSSGNQPFQVGNAAEPQQLVIDETTHAVTLAGPLGTDSAQILAVFISDHLTIDSTASPGTPSAGKGRVSVRDDGTEPTILTYTDDEGNRRPVSLMHEVALPLSALGRYSTGDTSVDYFGGTATADEYVRFNIDSDCAASWNLTMPHNYAGQDVAMRVTYMVPSGPIGGGRNFGLEFEFDRIENGRAVATVSYDTPTTQNQVPVALDTLYTATVVIPASSLDGAAAGDHVRMRLTCTAETSPVQTVDIVRLTMGDAATA